MTDESAASQAARSSAAIAFTKTSVPPDGAVDGGAGRSIDQGEVIRALSLAEAAHGSWTVYRGGADDDWASFYAAFLVQQSPLADVLGISISQAMVTAALVRLDRDYQALAPTEPWPQWYAANLLAAFSSV